MATLVSDIITQSFVDLAVIRPGETIDTASMQTPAFAMLNQMMSSLSAEPTMAYAVFHQAFTLSAGTDIYTVGTGGSLVSTARPVQIFNWRSKSGSFETSGRVVSFDELRQKFANPTARTSVLAEAVAADQQYASVNIQVFPVPAATPGTLTLDYSSPLIQFSTVGDSINLPDGWEEMLHFNLAVRLAPQFSRQSGIRPELAANATNSKNAIAAKNAAILGLQVAPQAA